MKTINIITVALIVLSAITGFRKRLLQTLTALFVAYLGTGIVFYPDILSQVNLDLNRMELIVGGTVTAGLMISVFVVIERLSSVVHLPVLGQLIGSLVGFLLGILLAGSVVELLTRLQVIPKIIEAGGFANEIKTATAKIVRPVRPVLTDLAESFNKLTR